VSCPWSRSRPVLLLTRPSSRLSTSDRFLNDGRHVTFTIDGSSASARRGFAGFAPSSSEPAAAPPRRPAAPAARSRLRGGSAPPTPPAPPSSSSSSSSAPTSPPRRPGAFRSRAAAAAASASWRLRFSAALSGMRGSPSGPAATSSASSEPELSPASPSSSPSSEEPVAEYSSSLLSTRRCRRAAAAATALGPALGPALTFAIALPLTPAFCADLRRCLLRLGGRPSLPSSLSSSTSSPPARPRPCAAPPRGSSSASAISALRSKAAAPARLAAAAMAAGSRLQSMPLLLQSCCSLGVGRGLGGASRGGGHRVRLQASLASGRPHRPSSAAAAGVLTARLNAAVPAATSDCCRSAAAMPCALRAVRGVLHASATATPANEGAAGDSCAAAVQGAPTINRCPLPTHTPLEQFVVPRPRAAADLLV
jgi:hypothetical protein